MRSAAIRNILVTLFVPAVLCACVATSDSTGGSSVPAMTEEAATPETSVDEMLQRMTVRQKVGQLFMVRPDALDLSLSQKEIDNDKASGVKELTDAMRQTLEIYPVGGICQFGKNISTPEQITAFNAELQAASEIPLLIAVDEEGGSVARLANNPNFTLPLYESAAAVGASGREETARQMGQTIGSYLRKYGFTMDFAPVADVWTNPDNTVIGTRAFSQNAGTAAAMAAAMGQGLQEEGILPTFKHFPGHGDTAEDSHNGLAYTYRTREEMEQCEFLPFLQPAVQEEPLGPYAIMVGHIVAPQLGTGDTPSSLSYSVVTELLRQDLLADRQVLVITDSLAMGAITTQYDPGEAALQAFEAGNDILLMPCGLEEAFETIVAAVENGTLSQERLDESVTRILRFKQQYAGLLAAATE